jgi:hypothetical protein
MFKVFTLGSFAVSRMTVNPLTGDARVRFRGGTKFYRFKVSRRAAAWLLINPPVSVGQWVNRHCLQRHETVCL